MRQAARAKMAHFAPVVVVVCLVVGAAVAAEDTTVTPTQTLSLFNGRNLDGLYTWQKGTGREDPSGVYSVRDGLLRISGEGRGCIATRQAFRDYRLVAEYKWGERTDGQGGVRNSGILLHAVGPDGGFRNMWMTSIEVQLAQGCEGDFIVIRGNDENGQLIPATITSRTIIETDGRTRWSPEGKPTVYSGRQFWWSKHDPEFKEFLDKRGRFDVASPPGEWTRVECVCEGSRITVLVNGVIVNECYDAFPSRGKILLENEGFEVLFRKLELHPLKRDVQDSDSEPPPQGRTSSSAESPR